MLVPYFDGTQPPRIKYAPSSSVAPWPSVGKCVEPTPTSATTPRQAITSVLPRRTSLAALAARTSSRRGVDSSIELVLSEPLPAAVSIPSTTINDARVSLVRPTRFFPTRFPTALTCVVKCLVVEGARVLLLLLTRHVGFRQAQARPQCYFKLSIFFLKKE